MNNILILDANVFLELSYEEGHFCHECDAVFELSNIKKTTQLIKNNEINPIHKERLWILKDIQNFYERNKGSKKYSSKRTYFQTTIEFKDIILDKIIAKDSIQIIKAVKNAIIYITKMMQYRINSLIDPLIQTIDDEPLHKKLINIIHDKEDAQHIIDSTFWASSNGNSDFITLNTNHFTKYDDQIKLCVNNHYGWANCNLNFTHPSEY